MRSYLKTIKKTYIMLLALLCGSIVTANASNGLAVGLAGYEFMQFASIYNGYLRNSAKDASFSNLKLDGKIVEFDTPKDLKPILLIPGGYFQGAWTNGGLLTTFGVGIQSAPEGRLTPQFGFTLFIAADGNYKINLSPIFGLYFGGGITYDLGYGKGKVVPGLSFIHMSGFVRANAGVSFLLGGRFELYAQVSPAIGIALDGQQTIINNKVADFQGFISIPFGAYLPEIGFRLWI